MKYVYLMIFMVGLLIPTTSKACDQITVCDENGCKTVLVCD